ncbi:transducin beta-like protein 2 isoform X2 [Hydractinia symbiolongicarpus]|uniref:transducin beta-like protein 2 isoform X2 n=1 Tax=Hydractinia symbiolongicarpus TaxID=13093 RepID=UPI00254EA847|nr:transducin beta-like protein 2 isoform X2 [Hydractinia symbiolongicarpus]
MAEEYDDNLSFLSVAILTTIAGALGIVFYLIFYKSKIQINDANEPVPKNSFANDESTNKPSKTTATKSFQKKKPSNKDSSGVSHPLLVASLKGHTGTVLKIDFSSNGKFMASCAEDRTARLWNVKDFVLKDHKYSRVNVEFDHATSISFSPDSRAFIVSLGLLKTIRVYKINKKKDEGNSSIAVRQEFDFPSQHKGDILNAEISSTGKFIMSADKDTQIIIWSLKGDVLEKIDTLLVYNSLVSISPCGNLVAACGFTSDVKIWNVGFNKSNGEFQQVSKVLELKGHSAGVLSFSFTNDSKRVGTVSKDGTWKIWDIDVNYLKGQDAYLVKTGSYTPPPDGMSTHIALSHDYFTVALALGTSIQLYNATTQELGEELTDVHQGNITDLKWHSESRQLVSAGGTDRSIRVWHNPVGVQASLNDLEEKLPKAKSESMKERIKQQIEDSKKYLALFQR